MSRSAFRGPQLPQFLLDQVQDGRVSKNSRGNQIRKEQGKTQHMKRKVVPSKSVIPRRIATVSKPRDSPRKEEDNHEQQSSESEPPAQTRTQSKTRDTKLNPHESPHSRKHSVSSEEDNDIKASEPVISKSAKARLEKDDADIAALEKKLGLKSKTSRRAEDDGLDTLIDGLDDGIGSEQNEIKRKRPEYEQWLRDKRRKASENSDGEHSNETNDSDGDDDDDDDDDDEENDFEKIDESASETEITDDDDFQSFDLDEHDTIPPKKVRENPYVAPVAKDAAAPKYVPPSRRGATSSDEETLVRLRRPLQGLLNRLSEANMLSILQSIEQIYVQNPRQLVSSSLIDMLIGLISDPATLNDAFIILHAGFTVGLYKLVGKNFGAQLLENIVEAFDRFWIESRKDGKQALNLMAFLSNLYAMRAVGSEIMFDYLRLLLENFSEANTELILRIIRISGPQLRQDDPSSLKDIVLLLQQAVTKLGEENLSVRTKFMIETIQNLKNNRMKTGIAASTLMAENLQRMKKTLGSLNSSVYTAIEPLRITLADIRDSEKNGKWWLVGASYKDPSKLANRDSKVPHIKKQENHDNDNKSENSQDVDLDKLARSQGMNTDVRRAIFVSVAGAVDYKHAHLRLTKLNLKNKQQLEIPRVLLHCIGSEPVYNHFYTLVAHEFCGDHKLRKAYEFALFDIFKRMGEEGDIEDGDPGDEQHEMSVQKMYNLANFYAWLIADNLLRLTVLKSLDLANLQSKTKVFVEVLLTTVMVLLRKKGRDGFELAVKDVFAQVHAHADLVTGLRYYISTVIAHTEIAADKREKKAIVQGCRFAVEALSEQPAGVA